MSCANWVLVSSYKYVRQVTAPLNQISGKKNRDSKNIKGSNIFEISGNIRHLRLLIAVTGPNSIIFLQVKGESLRLSEMLDNVFRTSRLTFTPVNKTWLVIPEQS